MILSTHAKIRLRQRFPFLTQDQFGKIVSVAEKVTQEGNLATKLFYSPANDTWGFIVQNRRNKVILTVFPTTNSDIEISSAQKRLVKVNTLKTFKS